MKEILHIRSAKIKSLYEFFLMFSSSNIGHFGANFLIAKVIVPP